jgi:hypothetical protein
MLQCSTSTRHHRGCGRLGTRATPHSQTLPQASADACDRERASAMDRKVRRAHHRSLAASSHWSTDRRCKVDPLFLCTLADCCRANNCAMVVCTDLPLKVYDAHHRSLSTACSTGPPPRCRFTFFSLHSHRLPQCVIVMVDGLLHTIPRDITTLEYSCHWSD